MFRMRFFVIAKAVFAATLFATSASAAIVFQNGFESPVVNHTGPSGTSGGYDNYGTGAAIGPWTVVGPAGRTDAVSVVTTNFSQNGINFPAQSGNQWADLAGQNANGAEGVEVTLPGLLNQAYTVSFWVGNVVDPNGVFGTSTTVNLLVNGVQVFAAINQDGARQATQVWRQYTYQGIGTSNLTSFTFLSGDPNNDNSTGLDSVEISTVNAVPEPATGAIMMLGLAGVGVTALRRRSKTKITA